MVAKSRLSHSYIMLSDVMNYHKYWNMLIAGGWYKGFKWWISLKDENIFFPPLHHIHNQVMLIIFIGNIQGVYFVRISSGESLLEAGVSADPIHSFQAQLTIMPIRLPRFTATFQQISIWIIIRDIFFFQPTWIIHEVSNIIKSCLYKWLDSQGQGGSDHNFSSFYNQTGWSKAWIPRQGLEHTLFSIIIMLEIRMEPI